MRVHFWLAIRPMAPDTTVTRMVWLRIHSHAHREYECSDIADPLAKEHAELRPETVR